jgi:putative adhesin
VSEERRNAADDQRQRDRERREREREERREQRRVRHAERHAFGFTRHGFDIDVDIDPDRIARSVSSFIDFEDEDDDGEAHDETIEKSFVVEGMPRLRVRNVSGETRVGSGEPGQVRVVARKRVRGASAERAKRLLENVEVRIEQRGNEIYVEPHLYEQERSWLDLFRGKRFRVDFDITVPRECAVEAQTVSGDLALRGIRGPARVESVSGDVEIEDVQGPMRVKSVSGDVECTDYVGAVEGSSVSGDVTIRGRVRSSELHTVSGDICVDLDPEPAGKESRLKTISGDVEVGLIGTSCSCDFRTASGDLECDIPARVVREGRKDRTVTIGAGEGRLHVKTVSGDLTIRPASSAVAEEPVAAAAPAQEVEATAPMAEPASSVVRGLLERLANGELTVDEAAAKLDQARKEL